MAETATLAGFLSPLLRFIQQPASVIVPGAAGGAWACAGGRGMELRWAQS